MSHIESTVNQGLGCITLNRPAALNALSLDMIRDLTAVLLAWRDDASVRAVAFRGMGRHGPFGAFCAGGDIRFFHTAAHAGDPALEDFFTEEYRLNHLIHVYPKPTVVFMDGIVMGGGMGLAQGCSLRVASSKTKMAMPETLIGLFPDVGGGHFLSRCPGHLGEYLGLTGEHLNGAQAVQAGLADVVIDAEALPALWSQLPARLLSLRPSQVEAIHTLTRDPFIAHARDWPEAQSAVTSHPSLEINRRAEIDAVFSAPDLLSAHQRLKQMAQQGSQAHGHEQDPTQTQSEWASHQLQALAKRSPLMLHVTWAQIRRARGMKLADELRSERDMVRHSFHPRHLNRTSIQSDTVEGIRALAVDKDHSPQWMHASIEDVSPQDVASFFESPWPAHAHPLADLKD